MLDLDTVNLTEENIVDIFCRNRAELYLLTNKGFLPKSISRQVGAHDVTDQSNFYDGLEFALFLYLERFFSSNLSKELAAEWVDVIANYS